MNNHSDHSIAPERDQESKNRSVPWTLQSLLGPVSSTSSVGRQLGFLVMK